jgi:uncharacterized membrane protein YoaT (DUF817 family)
VSIYTIYNVTLLAVLIPASWFLLPRRSRWRNASLAARIGVLIALFGFPWDFFAIRLGAWRYPNPPGAMIRSVPLNDLVLMWLCTYFATTVLIRAETWGDGGRERHPKGEHPRE